MITNRAKNNSSLLFIYFFLLAFLLAAPFSALAAEEFDPKTEKTLIEIFKENPNAIPLEPRDPARDVRAFRRDPNDNPKREPGPINIQKTVGGTWFMGIPTFFRLPVALGPEDLKAGKVEVAFFGAAQDMSTGQRGTAFGPQAVRTGEIVGAWGQGIPSGHPVVGDVNWMEELVAVDYGDAPIDILSGERSVLPVYEMAKEIAETGAIPVTVGGDHSLMYPDIAAASAVYGAENLAVIHFDAHYDGIPLMFGHYLSHGAMVRRLIDEGHVKGKNFYQIGLNSVKPSAKEMEWMRKSGLKFHFMQDIDARGWKAVMDEILADIKKGGTKYVFVSVDTDCLDPAWAPGMGTPEPGGLTIRELFPMLRAATIAHHVVGMELVEVNPIVDQTYRSRLVAVRILRELMTGLALRKKGITDPYYVDPDWVRHAAK